MAACLPCIIALVTLNSDCLSPHKAGTPQGQGQQHPGLNWRLRSECLFSRRMKDVGILILQFASMCQPCAWQETEGGKGPSHAPESSQTGAEQKGCNVKASDTVCSGLFLRGLGAVAGVAPDGTRSRQTPGGAVMAAGTPSSCGALRLPP